MNEDYDLEFRPKSYWGPQDLARYFGSHITGELRRRALKRSADDWDGPDDLLQSSLDEASRSRQAAIHPWLMGGEYLPPLKDAEVEIARVTLRSVTMDVFSLRARLSGKRIYYRLVDEYMEQGNDRFIVKPLWAQAPLRLKQVISIIEQNDLVDGFRNLNFDGQNIDHIYDFARVSSEFYPQLSDYFDDMNEEWRLAQWRERAAEEEDQIMDEIE